MNDDSATRQSARSRCAAPCSRRSPSWSVIGVVIALGTTIMVRALGLNESDSPGPVGGRVVRPGQAAADHGAPVPGEETEEPTDEPTQRLARRGKRATSSCAISPVLARPMERVNFTGTYKGADNCSLQVQRFEDGDWSDFGVTATVRVGTFATYIMTGRAGENRFRVFDPEAKQGSNVVLVTID